MFETFIVSLLKLILSLDLLEDTANESLLLFYLFFESCR